MNICANCHYCSVNQYKGMPIEKFGSREISKPGCEHHSVRRNFVVDNFVTGEGYYVDPSNPDSRQYHSPVPFCHLINPDGKCTMYREKNWRTRLMKWWITLNWSEGY